MDKLIYYRAEVDGLLIGFHNKTPFNIQISKNKSSYKTKIAVIGDVDEAIIKYNEVELKNNSRKRLIMVGSNEILLKRSI